MCMEAVKINSEERLELNGKILGVTVLLEGLSDLAHYCADYNRPANGVETGEAFYRLREISNTAISQLYEHESSVLKLSRARDELPLPRVKRTEAREMTR